MKTSPWKKIKKCKYLYIMMLLPIIYYILFHYLPLYGVLIAFKDYKIAKGVWGSPWVGFKWFEKFLADPYFWKLVKYITVKYLRTAVGLPGTDSSGIDVERSNKCKVQESDPDCQLPSAFHFHRGCLWYGNELLVFGWNHQPDHCSIRF